MAEIGCLDVFHQQNSLMVNNLATNTRTHVIQLLGYQI